MVTLRTIIVTLLAGLGLVFGIGGNGETAEPRSTGSEAQFADTARPVIQKYCLGCHSTKLKKGSLDLERFTSAADVRKNLKAWQQVVEMLDAGEMPPKDKPHPTDAEKTALTAWVRGFLDEEARTRAGDPGYVPLRRLSNAEYDVTIHALTGVDLRPTREFPADGAAGEGFTNAAEALTDISPALLTKYLDAAKEIAEHAVLLPDGFRFSPGKTRRDWTNESLALLRKEYAEFAPDGRLPLEPYLRATVRHRDALLAGRITIDAVAAKEKLNAKYLGVLWSALTDTDSSFPLDSIRVHWWRIAEPDAPALAAEIAAWQASVWKIVPIGSYRYGNSVRAVAQEPAGAEAPPANLAGYAAFRRVFPLFVCFPPVIPTDEAVSLKMFHREDESLIRLFLNDEQTRRLDELWTFHRFISRQPVAENNYLPQFIGFVTQDQPKELLAYFEGQRPAFRIRAEQFEKEAAAAIPKQLDALIEFAGRAYRRPVDAAEKTDLLALYHILRESKRLSHDEAFRGVLSRILASPAFLFRIEKAPPGSAPAPINDWELATRLSYFLWSAPPDDELRRAAAAGRLHDPKVLAEQTRRMLSSDRIRALAIEFGTQWIHVRGFDKFNEKSDKLFPQFDAALRRDIYEESIRFFQDLFQGDRPVTDILDSDATFLNENLAMHYGIPGVNGPEWRRVEGVKNYGRGGILGLASVQTRQAGAARTSPVLRGNWVVETLLGEKLPRPPANVPKLPEEEGASAGLTMRQLVEKHAGLPECAVCHRRIDPFGFALEHYDPIGRRRDAEIGGSAIDAHATLKDGTEFDGIDGLRTYLLTKKKDVIVRLFCRRLLGYALGRAVVFSDQPLIDTMVAELNTHDGRLSSAVVAIVRSPQFRMIRGADYAGDAP